MPNSTTLVVIVTPTTATIPTTKPITPTPTIPTTPPVPPTTVIVVPPVTPTPTVVAPPIPTPTVQAPTTPAVLSTVTSPVSASNAPPSIITVGGTTGPPVVVIQTITTSNSAIFGQSSTSAYSAGSATTGAANLNNGTASGSSGGLSGAGKTAVEVIVPITATALIALAVLFLWRRRRQGKAAQEARRKEMEEYGYNPNNDPTLPTVGAAGAVAAGGPITHDTPYDVTESDNGYRGWGATTAYGAASSGRKLSATMSGGGIGMAYSDGTSNHAVPSDARSGETLVGSPNGGRPLSTTDDTLGAMGPTGLVVRNADVQRGPSNASSSYSAANISEVSGDNSGYSGGGYGAAQQYPNDGHYGGQYGDGNYSGQGARAEMPAQPVIRDNQARRAPRIENPSHFPTPGSAGIAQNF